MPFKSRFVLPTILEAQGPSAFGVNPKGKKKKKNSRELNIFYFLCIFMTTGAGSYYGLSYELLKQTSLGFISNWAGKINALQVRPRDSALQFRIYVRDSKRMNQCHKRYKTNKW